MSLREFKIPAAILPELYKNNLVELTPKKSGDFRFLGGNEKKIAIIIDEKGQPFLKDEDLNWLQKMLQACKLNLADVAIVNINSFKLSAAAIRDHIHSKKMIMFGPSPEALEMPLNFPQFKPQEHAGCVYLYAPSPAELNQSTEEGKLLKTKLWVSLQKIFEL